MTPRLEGPTAVLACANALLFVQALADGDEQFGDTSAVLKALALSQPPVGFPHRPLITVPECCPYEAPEGQLPQAFVQLVPCGRQQFLSQLARQRRRKTSAAWRGTARYAALVEDTQALGELIRVFLFQCPKSRICDHFKRHTEAVPAAEEPGILLPVNSVQPQRLHMSTLKIVEEGKLVSGYTSPRTIAHRPFELLDLPAPGVVSVLWAINEFTLLLCAQQRGEVTAIEGANRPRRRCWICLEDLPGDVGGNPGRPA
jgi:hypothetical protein